MPETRPPVAMTLLSDFETQLARRPEAEAVIDDSVTLTYREVAAQARRVTAGLLAVGVVPEEPIGVLAHRRADLLPLLLGILRSGAAYVPVDPGNPAERTRRILAAAGCRRLVGHRDLLAALPTADGNDADPLARVERIPSDDLPREEERNAAGVGPGPGSLAYVLFTSGTTGNPKGVEVDHRCVASLLTTLTDMLGIDETDRCLAVSSLGFDVSVTELFLPLTVGGAVVIGERDLVLKPDRLVAALRRHAITRFQTGPSVWSMLLAEIRSFPRLEIAVTTGEAIRPELAERLAGVGDRVWNLYGPTETTVYATGYRLQPEDSAVRGPSKVSAPIGRPLPGREARVLDENRRPVAPGEAGELWLGGEGVARGYHGNEALTRERFVDLEGAGRRFYRTGDHVLQDADGLLHYLGRDDDQIKIRGLRIDPMEVESAVLAHPGVKAVAATWHEAGDGVRSLAVALVPAGGRAPDPAELHRFLTTLLPVDMVPSRFVDFDRLPLTAAGKVDRGAIRARVAEVPAGAIGPSPPGAGDEKAPPSETERTLVGIWKQVLGCGQVPVDAEFFAIGGDSLSGVRVMLRVEQAFEVSMTVRALFRHPVLRDLAAAIDRERGEENRQGWRPLAWLRGRPAERQDPEAS